MFLFVSGHSSAVWKCSVDKVVERLGFPVSAFISPQDRVWFHLGHVLYSLVRTLLDYQVVAAEMKGLAVLAAMDVNKPENSRLSRKYNITGFPTLLLFDGGELRYPYPGGNNT